MKRINLAVPAIILATALGASSGLYIKSLPFSSFGLTGFRMGIPFLFLLPLMIRRGKILGPETNRKKVWIGSLINTARMFLYVLAYKLTTLTNAVVLLYLWPIFALLINALIKRKPIRMKEALLLIMALIGVILMNIHKGFSLSGRDLIGSLVMISSALIFSITAIIFKDALADNSEGEVLFYQNAIGALVFLPFLFFEAPQMTLIENLIGVIYGLFVGVLGFGCFFYGLKRLSIFQYGALGYMEVFWGVLFGIVILGEMLLWNMILGALLILISSFLSRKAANN